MNTAVIVLLAVVIVVLYLALVLKKDDIKNLNGQIERMNSEKASLSEEKDRADERFSKLLRAHEDETFEANRRIRNLSAENAELKERLSKYISLYNRDIATPFSKYIWKKYVLTDQLIDYFSDKPGKACDIFDGISLKDVISFSCEINGSEGDIYCTTLDSCSCPYFAKLWKPCKHMFFLAIQLGVACMEDKHSYELRTALSRYSDSIRKIESENTFLSNAREDLKRESEGLKREIASEEEMLGMLKRKSEKYRKIINSRSITFPWISRIYADCLYAEAMALSQKLRYKSPPAVKAAEAVAAAAREKRKLIERLKCAEHIITIYESVAPWLSEFNDTPPKEIFEHRIEDCDGKTEYESMRRWLSRKEYDSLPPAEKYQLALDRYSERAKSNWEIGIDYERYIGYLYEAKDYSVIYHGAVMGFGDLGRDLIIKNREETLIVQCKRWVEGKVIHENHICQLYGSVVAYSIEHPDEQVRGTLVCTCSLSETAKKFADYLGIQVEYIQYESHPLIKCNINKNTKEKIYHLPFDQQYDRIAIDAGKGECYTATVKEAEKLGFRRAFRYRAAEKA